MVVISDTSIISNLLHLNSLELLQKLYQEIFIPSAVATELSYLSEKEVDLNPFLHAEWIHIQDPIDEASVNQLRHILDLGESEAIVLAIELKADYLLVDELLGRQEAARRGLNIVGTLGILLQAKQVGLIRLIQPLVDTLRIQGFWINDSLYQQVLKLAGE